MCGWRFGVQGSGPARRSGGRAWGESGGLLREERGVFCEYALASWREFLLLASTLIGVQDVWFRMGHLMVENLGVELCSHDGEEFTIGGGTRGLG